MEHLSSYQLEKYENIIKKIEEEHRKRNELTKEIELLDNKIIATGLTSKKDVVKDKVFKVLVKILFSIFDVYDQLSDKISLLEIEKLFPYTGCRYYFVEVYVSKSFQDKIIQKNWLISVSIKNSNSHMNKNVSLNKKVTNPICIVIPFDNSIEEAIVDVDVAWPGDHIWPCVKIASIPIEISYHFHLYSDIKIKDTFQVKVIKLSKLYGFQTISLKLPILKCQLASYTNFDSFIKTLIKNSYHNWDPRKDSCFSKTDYTMTAKTTAGLGNTISIELNTSTNSITLHGNPEELFSLKKYLMTDLFNQETYELKKDIGKNIKCFMENLENDSGNINMVMNIYNELSNIAL